MTKFQENFHQSVADQPHPLRCQEILKAHPEVAKLIGRNPYTALVLFFVLSLQMGLSYYLGSLGTSYWWLSVIIAFCVGAFANHSLYVIIHEATHNLIFKNRLYNQIAGILADMPNLMPSSMGFRIYHLKHHAHQGDYDYDADLASHWEANLIKNIWWRKSLWLLFFPIFQIMRPPRLKAIKLWGIGAYINLVVVLTTDVLIYYFFGANAIIYLLASFLFSIGLHPVGARWIQEHYTIEGKQETFSYYGILNTVAMNVGYHNEHHDFPSIPWNRLPALKRMAPEFYDTIEYHTSWTRLLLNFIFNDKYSLHSRVERLEAGKVDRQLN